MTESKFKNRIRAAELLKHGVDNYLKDMKEFWYATDPHEIIVGDLAMTKMMDQMTSAIVESIEAQDDKVLDEDI